MQKKASIFEKDGNFLVKLDNDQAFPVNLKNDIIEVKDVKVDNSRVLSYNTMISNPLDVFTKWHNRFGHASSGRIAQAVPDAITHTKTEACSACMKGKLTRLAFKGHFKGAEGPLAVVHGDLVGPISPATNGGARYFLTLVDQYKFKGRGPHRTIGQTFRGQLVSLKF